MAGCDSGPFAKSQADQDFSGSPVTITVLASEEFESLRPILDRARKATQVTVKLDTSGSSQHNATKIVEGGADGHYQAVWLASQYDLPLASQKHPTSAPHIDSSDAIASTPIVVGLAESTAARMGWDHASVRWNDIVDAAVRKGLTFGMTDPHSDSRGRTALVTVATAISGAGAALRSSDIAASTQRLRAFFSAQTIKAPSSKELIENYVRRSTGVVSGGQVDGLLMDEMTVIALNTSKRLPHPLTIVYPTDGSIATELTACLLSSANTTAKDGHHRLVSYLRSASVQRDITKNTFHRPVAAGIRPDTRMGAQQLFQLPFPNSPSVVEDLIAAYYGTLRRPARTIYVLDTSGSMEGERISQLKAAFGRLTGSDPDDTSRAQRIQCREQITLLPFKATPGVPVTFDVPADNPWPVLSSIRAHVDALEASGDTGIYDALVVAYELVAAQAASDPDRITSIVLLSDGERRVGRTLEQFAKEYQTRIPGAGLVPVFPVRFGDSDPNELRELAALTGGSYVDGTQLSLSKAFAAIRGNQ